MKTADKSSIANGIVLRQIQCRLRSMIFGVLTRSNLTLFLAFGIITNIAIDACHWSSPIDLSPLGQYSDSPQVTMNNLGDAVAVWVNTNHIIQAATYHEGRWDIPTNLAYLNDPDMPFPQVTMNDAGYVIATWTDAHPEDHHLSIQAIIYNGKHWGTPTNLSTPKQNARLSKVAMNDQGDAAATWQCFDDTHVTIQATIYHGNKWSDPVDLSVPDQWADSSEVVIDHLGNAVVIWEKGMNPIVQTATYDGNKWSHPVDLSDPNLTIAVPTIAMNSAGHAIAVWTHSSDTSHGTIQVATYDGKMWSHPVDLSVSGQIASLPSIAMNHTGNAVAAWQCFDGASNIVQAATYDGKTWSNPMGLSISSQASALYPDVAIDNRGNAVAVWQGGIDASHIAVQAATYNGIRWTLSTDLTTADQNSPSQRVAMDNIGNALVVWQSRHRSGESTIQAATTSSF